MSYTHNICFVANISIGDGTTYYLCSNTRTNGIILDGNTYNPFIMDVGDAEKIGNFGEGSTRGSCSMVLLFGQKQYGDSYNLNISKPWNNAICTIKIYDIDNDAAWSDCEDYFYGVIKSFKINHNNIEFSIDELNSKDNIILPRYMVEDYLDTYDDGVNTPTDAPEDSKGKRIPMQYGDLTDITNGIFAKGLLISNKIGFQKIAFDDRQLYAMDHIGIWETGLKRYFIGKVDGEYTIVGNKNSVQFTIDSTATLEEDLQALDGIQTILINGYQNLEWLDESDYDNIDTYKKDILSVNIIAIDSELMLLVEQPTSNSIRVERGYGESTVSSHFMGSSGTKKIYQSAKFSNRRRKLE
jgi:hypothetical protein